MAADVVSSIAPLLGPIITLLLAFFGFVVGVWRLASYWQSREAKEAGAAAAAAQTKAAEVEKELLLLRASLPLDYVRREDWIRNQTVIEAKLDGLATKLENLKERPHAC